MHISEGVLAWPVLAGGGALAAALVGVGLRRLPDERIARAGVMAAMVFVASLIHVPVGGASVHLVMGGLCGVLLGWAAPPVVLVALAMQAWLFGFGGLTTLGVNTLVMGVPALAAGALFHWGGGPAHARGAFRRGALAGAGAVAGGVALMVLALWLSGGRSFAPLIAAVLLAHVPVLVIEAVVTGVVLSSLQRSRPALLAGPAALRARWRRVPAPAAAGRVEAG